MATDAKNITLGLPTVIMAFIFMISITITAVTGYVTLSDDVSDNTIAITKIQETLEDNNLELIAYKITSIFKQLEETP